MNKILIYFLCISLLSLIPFGYFYYRDFIAQAQEDKQTKGCVPYDLVSSADSQTKITIKWNTLNSCVGYVLYGTSSLDTDKIASPIGNEAKSTAHQVEITELLPGNQYYFYVFSEGEVYGTDGLPVAISTKSI